MPISGLVIVLDGNDGVSSAAVESIRANSLFTIPTGPTANRVPAVLDTMTESESRAQIDWVRGLPGVAMVEVAYVNFQDTPQKEPIGHGP
jgi:hypothetical protein